MDGRRQTHLGRHALLLALAVLFGLAIPVSAAEYAVGYQIVTPFDGLSVKLPGEGVTWQPIVIARSDAGGSTYTMAARVLFNLGVKEGISRYWAACLGIERQEQDTVGVNVSIGAEFHRAQIGAPSVELGLYGARRDNLPVWGTTINVGWHFWF